MSTSEIAPACAESTTSLPSSRLLTLMRIELSESQWKEIQRTSGLPESAREQIEYELAFYRVLRQAAVTGPPAARTRTELRRTAKLAERLITAIIGANADARRALRGELNESRSLIGIMSSSDRSHILGALMPPAPEPVADAENLTTAGSVVLQGLGTPKRDAFNPLYEQLLAVERLRVRLENAARSLPTETTGAHKAAQVNLWLVGQLDEIVARGTRRHISRSNNNELQSFVDSCFAVADPNVGPGSVKKAIEAYVRLNPRRRTARAHIANNGRA
jgi:hypothetical protein